MQEQRKQLLKSQPPNIARALGLRCSEAKGAAAIHDSSEPKARNVRRMERRRDTTGHDSQTTPGGNTEATRPKEDGKMDLGL